MAEDTKKTKTTEASKKEAAKTSKKKPVSRPAKKKHVRKINKGQAHIQATYNNTIVAISDLNGNTLGWSSAGVVGFKGAKKSTPYAAGVIVGDVIEKVREYGIKELDVYLKGIGSGREAAVRALQANGLEVNSIKDLTPVPHNGPRPRKARRQ